MSKKCKTVGVYEDANKARLKHQTLIQDYHELQQDTDVVRSKLEAAKQRKLILAAEVRFLRRRYEYLLKTKNMNSSKREKLVQPPISVKQKTKQVKEARQHRLPPIHEPKPKKKHYTVKEVAQNQKKISRGGKMSIRKETLARNVFPVLDLNQKERTHGGVDSAMRNSIAAFDLNEDTISSPSEKDFLLPTRAPIFDLNEISNEDFVEGVKFEEVEKSSMRGSNDDMQNDLKLSICRNAGEGSSRVGKRKISWMDPVALRV